MFHYYDPFNTQQVMHWWGIVDEDGDRFIVKSATEPTESIDIALQGEDGDDEYVLEAHTFKVIRHPMLEGEAEKWLHKVDDVPFGLQVKDAITTSDGSLADYDFARWEPLFPSWNYHFGKERDEARQRVLVSLLANMTMSDIARFIEDMHSQMYSARFTPPVDPA